MDYLTVTIFFSEFNQASIKIQWSTLSQWKDINDGRQIGCCRLGWTWKGFVFHWANETQKSIFQQLSTKRSTRNTHLIKTWGHETDE